jgi:tRNA dimethylallyltransferase
MPSLESRSGRLRSELPPLIVLLGPTAVGKTALSIALCRELRGEIVSADSRQVYRGMDIGTAKATPSEQAQARHHLIDIRNPDQTLTLAEYQNLANTAIDEIQRRGAIPFLVGGSALYLRAVTLGLRIPEAPPDAALRAALEAELDSDGLSALVRRLQEVDPSSADAIDLRNPRRVLRALEIVLTTGRSKVELEGMDPPPYRILTVGLTRPRADLHRRIDRRVEAMVADGLVDETRRLLDRFDARLPALSSLGYREIGDYFDGACSLGEAVARIQIETHRFVRHQETWFRKMQNVKWFDLEQVDEDRVLVEVRHWLGERPSG